MILISGESQTPGDRRMWVSLASIPGTTIKGYVKIDKNKLNIFKNDPDHVKAAKQKFHDDLMKLGGQYIGTKNGYEFWAFDVVPASRGTELTPAVKSYFSKQLYAFDSVESGLFAAWDRKNLN